MRHVIGLAVMSALFGSALRAQGKFPPDSFTNLKVLPKTIGKQELIATMRSFALGLGVRCTYCHVGREGAPLDSLKFAADDKRPKRAARVMIDMVNHINEEHLADVPERPEPHVVVSCETCHRGVARPRLLSDEIALYLADSGLTGRCDVIAISGGATTAAPPMTSASSRSWTWRGVRRAREGQRMRSACCSSPRSFFPIPA